MCIKFNNRYIYGGIALLENNDNSFIFELMLIAYEFLFEELAKYLETHLVESKAHWLRLNFTTVYQKSFQNEKLQELQKWSNDIMVKYPNKIFDSENFTSLQENALVSLISRDDLQMEEVKIWNRIIEWGIAQNPGLPSNPEDWSYENFLALKTTLRNCLPLIRYFQMSGVDIIDNVQPYQQILEKNLWNDIMKKLVTQSLSVSSIILPPRIISAPTLPTRVISTPILPTRVKDPFSMVISDEHSAEIASWVDRKDHAYSVTNNPYKFKLLLRGTRDGFAKDSFWNLCNKQTHLIVVIKVKGTDEILGGYNPVGWNKLAGSLSIAKSCNDSFIFSLKNGTIQNSILSRVTVPKNAICCNYSYGPLFGFKPYCVFVMHKNFNQDKMCWLRNSSDYEKSIRNESTYINNASYFSAEEYEIFQISKKS
ncbi:hypothetical protein C2G38_2028228 [Gigaspora rosea]|uniref:TLDc domain-containing protein n=1 Tax=Gigaspora rosea TaxID=44941 RepID=A0A397W286_9GLOM|nr:hypothetical protein C2G38_2028228 [Gigaspora rosea]